VSEFEIGGANSVEFVYGVHLFTNPGYGLVALDFALASQVEQLTDEQPTYDVVRRIILTAEQAVDLGGRITSAGAEALTGSLVGDATYNEEESEGE
jgi:hypothetical protein